MYPDTCWYTKEHEWIRRDGDVHVVGITSFATEQLGDITYVELPAVGDEFGQGEAAAAVESVKSASDVYCPAGGRVCAVNGNIEKSPEVVNQDPYGEGYFFKLEVTDEGELDSLMDAAAYETYVQSLEDE